MVSKAPRKTKNYEVEVAYADDPWGGLRVKLSCGRRMIVVWYSGKRSC